MCMIFVIELRIIEQGNHTSGPVMLMSTGYSHFLSPLGINNNEVCSAGEVQTDVY